MTEQTVPECMDRGLRHFLWRKTHGRWGAVRWGFSLLLPIALLLWVLVWDLEPEDPQLLAIRAVSQVTGEGIAHASITVDGVPYKTDDAGEIQIDPVPAGTQVVVSAIGYETMQKPLDGSPDRIEVFSLSGVLIPGMVSDALSGSPVEGAELTVVNASGTPVAATRTDEVGGFVFKLIPEDSRLVVAHEVYGVVEQSLGGRRSANVSLAPPPVSGRLVDERGRGIEGVTIAGPRAETVTGPDGRFTLHPVGQGAEIIVSHVGPDEVTIVVEGSDLGDIVLPSIHATPEAGS